ncbi:MAG: hypothetical protein M0042_04710 [Nitrospiraceae bacterium]|nr:hypothetical protein [Nitrospiraceae bacterium]
MNTVITLCRDINETADTDCIEDHEGTDVRLVAPCTVERNPCDKPVAAEQVGAEAESSATIQNAMVIQDCCDCG